MTSQAAQPTQAQQTRSGFLKLPLEIRLEIYRLVLPTGTIVDIMERPTFLGERYWLWVRKCQPPSSDDGSDYDGLSDDPSPWDGPEDDGDAEDEGHPDEEDLAEGEGYFVEEDAAEANTLVITGSSMGESEGHDPVQAGDSAEAQPDQQEIPIDDWAEEPIEVRLQQMRTIRGLLLSCRLIREEVLDVLYGDNIMFVDLFSLGIGPWNLGDAKMARIRHLELVLRWQGMQQEQDSRPLAAVLPNLRTLGIVAEQPPLSPNNTGTHHWRCDVAVKRRTYLAAVQTVLQCVQAKLSAEARLVTDIGGHQRRDLLSLFNELSHPRQSLRTRTGDRIFQGYSRESYDEAAETKRFSCFGCVFALKQQHNQYL